MCEWWDYSRGFFVVLPRHKIGSKDCIIIQGPKHKRADTFFFLWFVTIRDGHNSWRTGTCSGSIRSTGFQVARSLGETQNGERRSRGSQGGSHRRWRRRGADGFWRCWRTVDRRTVTRGGPIAGDLGS
jgi:hypothetical protein